MLNLNKNYSFIGFKGLKHKIEGYGFSYSFRKYALTLFLMLCSTMVCCIIYRLNWQYTLIISMLFLALAPMFINLQYKYLYEHNRFNEVKTYIEIMGSSFRRNPKILIALEETLFVMKEGAMQQCLIETIDSINKGKGENIMRDALSIIERKYNCQKILDLHKFMLDVEEKGGDYTPYLDNILMGNKRWIERTYLRQKALVKIRNRSILAIIISFAVGGMTLLVRKYADITTLFIYQITSMVFIICCILFYAYIQKKLNISWLKDAKSEKRIMADFNNAVHFNASYHYKKSGLLAMIIAAAGVACIMCYNSGILKINIGEVDFSGFINISGYLFLLYAIFVMIYPTLIQKKAMSNTLFEIESAFSEWLRIVAMNLQFNTIQMAIINSYDDCPAVLKEDLKSFIDELNENNIGIEPYTHFLERYNLLDISSTVTLLYSYTAIDVEEAHNNLSTLIERNDILLDTEEKYKNEASVRHIGLYNYIPLTLAILKMLIDLISFVDIFLAMY